MILGYNGQMDTTAYFEQIAKNIQNLVVQGRVLDAYNQCNAYLKKYPMARPLILLRDSIVRKLSAENEGKVKIGVKEAEKFANEGKEADALIILRDLLKIAPDSNKLRSMYVKIEQKYRAKMAKQEVQFLETKKQELKSLLDKEENVQYLEVVSTLENNYKDNPGIQRLVVEAKENYIKHEIHQKADLINSDKFKDIDSFMRDLKNVYKDSVVVQEVLKRIKSKKMGAQIENIENYIYSGQTSLDTLMKLKKYEEAMEAATEILQADPLNQNVREIFKKAKKKAFAKNRANAVHSILEKLPLLKLLYKENKEAYIKL